MAIQKLDRKRALPWRTVLTVALVVVTLYLLSAHWHAVSVSLRAASRARIGWLLVSLLLMLLSFCIASYTYQILALKRLRYRQTLLVEIAGAFVGRLLPAGLGGLGLNGVYLFKRKHTPAEATAVVSVNNLLGMCAHGLLLLLLAAFEPRTVLKLLSHLQVHISPLWVVVVIAVLIFALLTPFVRTKLLGFGRNLLISLRKERPTKIMLATLSSALLTMIYTILLYCTSHAVGISVGILGMFVIFSFGILVGTATPTPGGLVGAEAGLFVGFVSFGVSDVNAGAAVLLFRLVTYWLPLIPGAVALVIARKHKLL